MNPHTPSKYRLLTTYLRAQRADEVQMSFAEIEHVIGAKLPRSADTHHPWWSNNPADDSMTHAWLDAGFETGQVDLPDRKLVFRRVHGGGLASAAFPDPETSKPALFGWLRGTMVAAGDVTEPADPEWAVRSSRGEDKGRA
jgi:hypothetical protein